MVQGDRQLLWHPRLDYKFLVGGGSQVTAYELLPDSNQSKYVASKHDIAPLKVTFFLSSMPRHFS